MTDFAGFSDLQIVMKACRFFLVFHQFHVLLKHRAVVTENV